MVSRNISKLLNYVKFWKLTWPILAAFPLALLSFIILSDSAIADYFDCFDRTNCTNALSSSSTCLNPRDYHTTALDVGSDVTVLSFHGGKIELRTSEIASAMANKYGWNHYDLNAHGTSACLQGKSNFKRLHITATNFDDPDALNIVRAYPKSIAIHGYGNFRGYPKGVICVGGGNQNQVTAFIDYVNQNKSTFESSPDGYSLIAINATSVSGKGQQCYDLKGTSPNNIVNKNASNGGLQLELSLGMRKDLANLNNTNFNLLRNVIYGAVAQAMI